MKARISTPYDPQIYSGFVGLSTARADIALESPEAQACVEMDNVYATRKGYLTNEPGLSPFQPSEKNYISHVRQLSGENQVVYAARIPGSTSLRAVGSSNKAEAVWPRTASVCSTVFNGQVVLAAGQSELYRYDGYDFKKITSPSVVGGKYLCAIQNRLVVAGFSEPGRINELAISRVNNPDIHTTEEAIGEASVLQAAKINIQNLIQTGDRVRGIGLFEAGALAAFTNDRVLVYAADPDYTKWTLVPSFQAAIGTISHKSIVSIGGEIFFCSRAGVHSLRRSVLNGTSVFTTPMSDEVTELYQSLVSKVQNQEDISAYFDQDDGRLHIMFPVNDLLCYRLSAALSPPQTEQDITKARWSLSSYGGVTCGERLAGKTIVGSIAGMRVFDQDRAQLSGRGKGFVQFPILYHKNLFDPKSSMQLFVIASGSGRIYVDAKDEMQRQLGTLLFELPATDQDDYVGVPLQRQFTRPFSASYMGLRLKVRVESEKPIRIYAIGVLLKKEE